MLGAIWLESTFLFSVEEVMAKKKKVEHRWSGAGFVCADCGAIKDTEIEREDCPRAGKAGFDVWLYHAGAGWWLDEFEVRTSERASQPTLGT